MTWMIFDSFKTTTLFYPERPRPSFISLLHWDITQKKKQSSPLFPKPNVLIPPPPLPGAVILPITERSTSSLLLIYFVSSLQPERKKKSSSCFPSPITLSHPSKLWEGRSDKRHQNPRFELSSGINSIDSNASSSSSSSSSSSNSETA